MKKNGNQCNAFAMKGLDCCFLHNPKISNEEKKDAQSKGGKGSIKQLNSIELDPMTINDTCDISQLIIDTINQVRYGTMDVKTANCIGFLSNHLMKAYELTTLEKKLDAVRQSLDK